MKSLTQKQTEALELVYTNDPAMTYAEVAEYLGISRDSLQDRLDGAIKKFKKDLPELFFIENKMGAEVDTSYYPYLYDGLYNKDSGKTVPPLYRINPVTNERVEISQRLGKPKPASKPPNRIRVRAWAIHTSPVPDLIDTDFYLGLIPDGVMIRRQGRSKFRG